MVTPSLMIINELVDFSSTALRPCEPNRYLNGMNKRVDTDLKLSAEHPH